MTPIGSFALPATHPVFAGHFPAYPIVPGALLLALTEARASAWLREHGHAARITGVVAAKFKRPVRPEQACTLLVAAPAGETLRFRLEVDGVACVIGTLRLAAGESSQAQS